MSNLDFDSLEGIYKTITSGHYNLSPVEIGNLTLKVGRMVDAMPDEYNVQMVIGILLELLSNASNNNDMMVYDALLHKFEYMTGKYSNLMSSDVLKQIKGVIAAARQQFIAWLKTLPPASNVNVLRRVEHSTLHYDFDGFVDALSIDERQNFYEIASVPVETLIGTGVVHPRYVINEDKPQRVNGGWGGNDGPRFPGGPRGGNNPNGPDGPQFGYANVPPRRPPHDTPPYSPEKGQDWRYFDILDLVVISVLNSLTSVVKPVPGGCQLVLKQEVMEKRFKPYDFCYGYNYLFDDEDDKDSHTEQETETHVFKAVKWGRIVNSSLSKSGDMSAQEYACRFLDLVGLTPQIGADNVVIVRGNTLIKGFYDFFDLKNLKNDTELLSLCYRMDMFRPIRRELLLCTSIDLQTRIERNLAAYTPAMSSKFWEHETRLKDLMAYVNARNFDQRRR